MERPNLFWTQDPNEIGPFLRQVRIAKSITGVAVATAVGHTPSFIANVEAGRRLPSLPSLMTWIKFLEIQFMLQAVEEDQ